MQYLVPRMGCFPRAGSMKSLYCPMQFHRFPPFSPHFEQVPDEASSPCRREEALGRTNGAPNWQHAATPDLLGAGEVEWGVVPNLDRFFSHVYRCP